MNQMDFARSSRFWGPSWPFPDAHRKQSRVGGQGISSGALVLVSLPCWAFDSLRELAFALLYPAVEEPF
jgi:hypothetical protein